MILSSGQTDEKGDSMNSRKPLEGIKVVDFSWLLAGPITTRIVSDYGEKVEVKQ